MGDEDRIVATGADASGLYDPAWSPDGKTIVCYTVQPAGALTALVAVDVNSAKQQTFYRAESGILSDPVWLPDGSGLLALVRDQASNFVRRQLIHISYPDGRSHSVTRDTNNYTNLGLAADGHTAATVLNENHWNLFGMNRDLAGDVLQLTSGSPVHTFSWAPDSRLIIDQNYGLSALNPDAGSQTSLFAEETHWRRSPRHAPMDAISCSRWRCTTVAKPKTYGGWTPMAEI